MKYDPINKIMVEDSSKTKDSDNKVKDAKTKKYKVIYDRYNPQLGVSERTSIYEVANKTELNKKLKSLANPVYGRITIKEVIEMKDSKTQDLEKSYFDPLYKDTRRAIVKEVQNYLSSKGYNNSVGKYDKVVFGVRSLLEKTLLQPGTDKFNDAVHREADRLLKKYNLTKDSIDFKQHQKYWSDQYHRYFLFKGINNRTGKYIFEDFGDVRFEFSESEAKKLKVKTKDDAGEFNRLVNFVNSLNNELGSDWLKLNGKAVHPDYAKREILSIKKSIARKVNSNELTKDEAQKLGNLINQVLKHIDETKRKYTGYDSKTVDAFDKVDIKAIFGNTDRRWLKAKNDIKNAINKTNDVKSLEKLYDFMDYSEIYDDYMDIWNEVGKYAQDKRRQCINELSEMKHEIFKKISKLDKE